MNEFYNRNVVEAALLAAGKPLTVAELGQLFEESTRPNVDDIRAVLDGLAAEYSNRGLEMKETAAGFRIQVRREFAGEISRLWPERPAKYSRALLETLALIAYRQPITRAEIEAVRGVAVNPNIVKTVIERNWVRVVGHRDVPGRPELLGTTREFLDYFGLRSLDELPPLAELKATGDYNLQLDLPNAGALEAPKGEGEVEGVAGLLGSDAAVVSAVAEAAGVEAAADASGVEDGAEGSRVEAAADASGVEGGAEASHVEAAAGASGVEGGAEASHVEAAADAFGVEAGAEAFRVEAAASASGVEARADASHVEACAHASGVEGGAEVSAAIGAHNAVPDGVAEDGAVGNDSGATDVVGAAVADGVVTHDALADAAGAHDGAADAVVANDAVADAADAHDGAADADGLAARSGAHELNSGRASAHDATTDAHDVVSHAAGVYGEVVSADSHDARSGIHEAMSHATTGVHNAVSRATGAHDSVAKADVDDDVEVDRALSAVDAVSSEAQDALDDTSEDDADDDELSADGHGSRELVAAPRDSDN
jgi:segregation and condensation protein B